MAEALVQVLYAPPLLPRPIAVGGVPMCNRLSPKRAGYCRRIRRRWFRSSLTLLLGSTDTALERERQATAQENQRHLGHCSKGSDFADSIPPINETAKGPAADASSCFAGGVQSEQNGPGPAGPAHLTGIL